MGIVAALSTRWPGSVNVTWRKGEQHGFVYVGDTLPVGGAGNTGGVALKVYAPPMMVELPLSPQESADPTPDREREVGELIKDKEQRERDKAEDEESEEEEED
ncbi:hypothetical protein KIPB_002145 [Kipferlia bialata]|uniref:Uncharacterized protein n=1 Tax=Kipferlia bialata TaxID=797122 RepID=A0A9K3GGG2_9EUKA|nr:hypothetical protein KIPB_002145 [Kipferlia bialata]|eukprot:g2145.t1